ncbi:MAG: Mannosylfructose-phosphate phosphatase [Alphaproteobacteria bacterium ADurb.Bin438]|nr:MAG: Mannosylfructose-phosphate phosphatase [Alphaproteobacteria bacterium ADurb.Bin438]
MKLLHITDYDGTLIPEIFDEEMENKKEYAMLHADAYSDFIKQNENIKVIYCTGRTVDNIANMIDTLNLPKPDYIIGAVGVEIFDVKNNAMLKEWEDYLKTSKWDNAKIKELTKDFEILHEMHQREYRFCFKTDGVSSQDVENLRKKLFDNGLEVHTIYSSYYFDIIPLTTNKGKAGVFLAKYLGYPLKNVAISGDSRNDADMFKEDFGFKITPINAETELLEKVKDVKNFYQSKDKYSFGTIDGLKQFLKIKQG